MPLLYYCEIVRFCLFVCLMGLLTNGFSTLHNLSMTHFLPSLSPLQTHYSTSVVQPSQVESPFCTGVNGSMGPMVCV